MSHISSKTHTQEQLDHYSNQNNLNNEEYQANLDNYANQLNPNNDEYWHSRGEERPKK
jgi:type II secretory pathway component HofQ